ncbi:hypothetical protein TUBRATIS_009680 [Tubulinosema ratisbonensis]|uniref:Uncharacterized protein n=1 Tax=Tubulinosema ratisbonensis TaxID=291195 RepID=A0A437AMT9_9MICR|nr:hypothetical protein TUBRATIS_009680 [Tubulinosema ratisbonensis]
MNLTFMSKEASKYQNKNLPVKMNFTSCLIDLWLRIDNIIHSCMLTYFILFVFIEINIYLYSIVYTIVLTIFYVLVCLSLKYSWFSMASTLFSCYYNLLYNISVAYILFFFGLNIYHIFCICKLCINIRSQNLNNYYPHISAILNSFLILFKSLLLLIKLAYPKKLKKMINKTSFDYVTESFYNTVFFFYLVTSFFGMCVLYGTSYLFCICLFLTIYLFLSVFLPLIFVRRKVRDSKTKKFAYFHMTLKLISAVSFLDTIIIEYYLAVFDPKQKYCFYIFNTEGAYLSHLRN